MSGDAFMSDSNLQGWHTRGYLPHLKVKGGEYFVTFRLADSLPRELLARLAEQRRLLDATEPANDERVERRRIEQWSEIERQLDVGTGACHLRRPEIARLVAGALRHFDGQRYELHAWVVMPNHVHALVTSIGDHALGAIVKSWKQFTALRANRLLGLPTGRFWQPESYDHWVRNCTEHDRFVRYIHENPVKGGLCARAEDWPWSSATNPPPAA